MAFGKGSQKLGHPVPLSNFLEELNNGNSQPAHRKTPSLFSLFKGLLKALSVPSSLKTWKASGDNRFLQSSFDNEENDVSEIEAAKTFFGCKNP